MLLGVQLQTEASGSQQQEKGQLGIGIHHKIGVGSYWPKAWDTPAVPPAPHLARRQAVEAIRWTWFSNSLKGSTWNKTRNGKLRSPFGEQFRMPILVRSFSHTVNRGPWQWGRCCWKPNRIFEGSKSKFSSQTYHCRWHGDESQSMPNNLINAQYTIHNVRKRKGTNTSPTSQSYTLQVTGKHYIGKKELCKASFGLLQRPLVVLPSTITTRAQMLRCREMVIQAARISPRARSLWLLLTTL